MSRMVRGSNLSEGQIFLTHPDRLTQPPTQWVPSFGCGANHLLSSSTEVKERVELHPYLPSVPSWHVIE
jgi:hypothetical protein